MPLDIFQKGLIHGAERLPYDPEKRYFYVEHPVEGWRVYLRACCFIHKKAECSHSMLSSDLGTPIDYNSFIVVKRVGKSPYGNEWEPPKGQMEGKDGLRAKSVKQALKDNIRREVAEEARIKHIIGLEETGLVFQGRENDYPPNHYFQYHIFRAQATAAEIQKASDELAWCREHPLAFARMKRDKREKDEISWFSPSETKLMGKWSPKIVVQYLNKYA